MTPLPPAEELSRLVHLRESALQAGITVSSPSNPAIDGIYPCHNIDQISIRQELNHLDATATGMLKKLPRHVPHWNRHEWKREAFFNNGTMTKMVHDIDTRPHTFTVAEFRALGAAIIAYDEALKKALSDAVNGARWIAPSNHVVIDT